MLLGAPLSAQADVYSLGVLLWELFSGGGLPWAGKSSSQVRVPQAPTESITLALGDATSTRARPNRNKLNGFPSHRVMIFGFEV